MRHSNPSESNVAGSVMNSLAEVLSAAKSDIVQKGIDNSAISLRIVAQVYMKNGRSPIFGGHMSTVLLSQPSWRNRARQGFLIGIAALTEMPFLDHLEELRRRIIKCLIGLGAG